MLAHDVRGNVLFERVDSGILGIAGLGGRLEVPDEGRQDQRLDFLNAVLEHQDLLQVVLLGLDIEVKVAVVQVVRNGRLLVHLVVVHGGDVGNAQVVHVLGRVRFESGG